MMPSSSVLLLWDFCFVAGEPFRNLGTASAVCGYLPILWFGPTVWPISMAAGLLFMLAMLLLFGRNASKPVPDTTDA